MRALVLATVLALPGMGCSALVSPDEARLGGDDGGTDSATGDGSRDSDPGDAADSGRDAEGDGGGGCPDGCDDGVACTADECVDDACVQTPNDDACPSGEVCDPALGCTSASCEEDEDCDDGAFCNGEESCDPSDPSANGRGCVTGDAVDCDDDAACTADSCDEDADACVNEEDDALCDDGIDCTVDRCRPAAGAADERGCRISERDGRCASADFCTVDMECSIAAGGCVGGSPRDCRDGDVCTADSCDSSAGMCVNVGRDEDGDGYDASSIGGTTCATGTDCDDGDPFVNPAATEFCNMRDDDCDGLVDELCTPIPDTCASAEPIRVVVGGATTTVTGRLGSFGSDYQSPCGLSGGLDAVYYVDVTSTVDLTIDTLGSAADTVLAVSTVCSGDGFRALGCDDDIDRAVNRQSRVWVHRFGPVPGDASARLYILVDGRTPSETGDFTLNVSAAPAAADACATPIDISGGGALIGFVAPSPIAFGFTGSCQAAADSTDSEAIAEVTGPPDGNVGFNVFSNFFDPDLYLRDSPCATGSEVDCVAGDGFGAAGFRFHTAMSSSTSPGSSYFLFVDGVTTAGAYLVSYEP